MIRNTNILIQRLKLQPIHGMAKKLVNEDEARRAALNTEIQNLKETATDALDEISDSYGKVYDAFNKTNLALQTGISKMTGIFDGYATAMTNLVKEATFLEQRNKTLNKTFGITSTVAAELGESYDSMADTLGTGGEKIRKFGQNINAILPGMGKMIANAGKAGSKFKEGFNTQLLGTNQLLTDHMGLTSEVSNNYQLYAAGAGANSLELLKTTQEWADEFDKATGMVGSFATAVSEVANLSADVQMTYKRYPGNLEKAVIKAKLLGTEFAKIEAMATKMLDIESSVGQELEYQLLSGKRLVNQQGESITENLRIAKLSGNAEAQVKAMNDLLESQGDILDGNNYYAKEQLAQLTGFSVAELTRQRQTRKLMEEGGMTEAELKDILNKDPKDFAEALKDRSESEKALLTSLKQDAGQKTTDEKFADFLDRERTQGIKLMSGNNQAGIIAGTAGEVKAAQGTAGAYGAQFMTPGSAAMLGKTQLLGEVFEATKKPVDDLIKILPVVNEALSTLSTNIGELKTKLVGTKGTAGRTGIPVDATPEDAVLVNDAMIQFHPADKFATVSDGAALLASTERGKLDSAVDSLTGGSNKNAVIDPTPIATAVAAAVQQAMAGINIVMSGEKLNKAMEFENRYING